METTTAVEEEAVVVEVGAAVNKMGVNILAEAEMVVEEVEAEMVVEEVATDEGVVVEDSIWPPVRYCHHWKNLLK